MPGEFKFKAKLWQWQGPAAWFFVSVPEAVSTKIRAQFGHESRGFGSLPVSVTIGVTTWKTSIFYDGKRKSYMLPVKANVRTKEKIREGTTVLVRIAIIIS